MSIPVSADYIPHESAAKDLRYINNIAAEAQVMTVMASAARHYYAHVEAIGHADDYVPMLSDHVGRIERSEHRERSETEQEEIAVSAGHSQKLIEEVVTVVVTATVRMARPQL